MPDALRLDAPAPLPRAADRGAALGVLASALGVSAQQPRRWVETEIPLPALRRVLIDYGYLAHIVENDTDAREPYAHFILPTRGSPFEVWATRQDHGTMRPRLIGLFRGDRQLAAILRRNRDGSLFYNVINADDRRLDGFRVGRLLSGRRG